MRSRSGRAILGGVILAACACGSHPDGNVVEPTSVDVLAKVVVGGPHAGNGCADVTLSVAGQPRAFRSVPTPWYYEFSATVGDTIHLFGCPTCENCSLLCNPDDGTTVAIAINGVWQPGHGVTRGCVGENWVVPP